MPMTGLGNVGVSVVVTPTTSKGMNNMKQLVIDTGHFRAYLIKNHPQWNGRTVIEVHERFADMISSNWSVMLSLPLTTYLRIAQAALPNIKSLPDGIEEALATE